jgi:cell division protein FtsB
MLERGAHKIKLGRIVKIASVLLVFSYILYHIVYGDRGVISLLQYTAKYQKTLNELESTKIERLKLQHRVGLLKTDSIDKDLLEEQAKRSLSVSKESEILIYDEDK